MKKRISLSRSLMAGLALGAGLLLTSAPKSQADRVFETPPEAVSPAVGQTSTMLSDGRLLILGGERGGQVLDVAVVEDHRTQTKTRLHTGLHHSRAWHSATVLPDGTVLVLGGLSSGGSLVHAAELFDPDTETFHLLPSTGLAPRAYHTATLLTDGHVLIAGGVSEAGELAAQLEAYDFRSQSAMDLPDLLDVSRKGHIARLLPDGRVLLSGGTGRSEEALDYFEVIDPELRKVTVEPLSLLDAAEALPPSLEDSLPHDGAVEVPLDAVVALRFSKPLRVETVAPDSIALEGPRGRVEAKAVLAEDGRLIFLWPLSSLHPRTEYTVSLIGPTDGSGLPLREATIHFTTGALLTDDEDWIPNARNLRGDWRSNRPDSRWRSLPPLKAPRGVTALAGQVLTLNGQPLSNATLEIDGTAAHTDRTGRFLLSPLSPGHHELLIDGRSANKAQRTYGIFEAGINVINGETNVLPYTIWMPKIDTLHTVTIPYPTTTEVVITTPRIPGLELHLPPKTIIWDHQGQLVTQISITPIPVDRPLCANMRETGSTPVISGEGAEVESHGFDA